MDTVYMKDAVDTGHSGHSGQSEQSMWRVALARVCPSDHDLSTNYFCKLIWDFMCVYGG